MDNKFNIGDVVAINSRVDNHIISGHVLTEPLMVVVEVFQPNESTRYFIDAQYYNAVTGSYETMFKIPSECFKLVEND